MKGKSFPYVFLGALLLGGCYVRVPVNEATAEPLTDLEVKQLGASGRASVPGNWFRVRAVLPRRSVQKIARWELHTHMILENCQTEEMTAIADNSGVEETDGNFNKVRDLLRSDPKRSTFAMSEPAFFQTGKSLDGVCLRLEGGSYTLQKISSDRVPLQFIG